MSLALVLASLLSPAFADEVNVTFLLTVPKETPATAAVYLAGSADAIGAWSADGVQLTRQPDNRYRCDVALPAGTKLEFKFTLGTWDSVEKSDQGADVPNRRMTISGPGTHEFEVRRWGGQSPRSSLTGDIRFHPDFASKILGNQRPLAVYLPPGYDAAKSRRYPVLYMHDGQNLFDARTSFIGVEWQADETAKRLIRENKIPPLIIVGIYNNADRMAEYTPTRDATRKGGGRGDDYMRFVIEEVKPFIDRTYRTLPDREHTAVAGSSLGGLISLYMGLKHPEVFSQCGVISPALMWDNRRILRMLDEDPAALKKLRIWLDMGSKEGATLETFRDATDCAREFVRILRAAGRREGVDYKYLEVPGAVHNEGAWAARFDQVLEFFYTEIK